jgi:hypothetical protein
MLGWLRTAQPTIRSKTLTEHFNDWHRVKCANASQSLYCDEIMRTTPDRISHLSPFAGDRTLPPAK